MLHPLRGIARNKVVLIQCIIAFLSQFSPSENHHFARHQRRRSRALQDMSKLPTELGRRGYISPQIAHGKTHLLPEGLQGSRARSQCPYPACGRAHLRASRCCRVQLQALPMPLSVGIVHILVALIVLQEKPDNSPPRLRLCRSVRWISADFAYAGQRHGEIVVGDVVVRAGGDIATDRLSRRRLSPKAARRPGFVVVTPVSPTGGIRAMR